VHVAGQKDSLAVHHLTRADTLKKITVIKAGEVVKAEKVI